MDDVVDKYILSNNKMMAILYKDSFVDGSWEECKELISSKMSK